MNSITAISSILIIVGAVIMALNIRSFQQVMITFKNISHEEYKTMKSLLRFHLLLIVSFLGGYLLVLFAIHSTIIILGNLFVSLIFIFGSIFVFLAILIQKKMIQALGSRYQESLGANVQLSENQDTLSKTNKKLEKEIEYRKKMEKQLIQSEKMTSVGGLAAGMAHEINNPLAGMVQNAQLVLNRLSKDMPANVKAAQEAGISLAALKTYIEKRQIYKKLENINVAGERAAKIIVNMLDFTRGNVTEKSFHDLGSIIDKSIEIIATDYDLKDKYDLKHIDIQTTYELDLPMIQCETNKIQQVVFNLVKNAAEAIHYQEEGLKKNSWIHIRLYKQGKNIVMEIEDNGPGIPPEIQKRVFEPFFTTKPMDRGTGLGLSVSYFIVVDDHGGKMTVSAPPGKGSLFSITLPLSCSDE